MYVVQCPYCRRKFKVQALVTDARMKCSRCGQSFVGSSVEETVAPISPVPSNVEGSAPAPPAPGRSTEPRPPQTRRTTSTNSIILLIVGIFGILGVIAMIIAAHYKLTHPTVIVRDVRTGRIIGQEKTTMAEAERKVAKHRADAGGNTPSEQSPGSSGQTVQGDPKLQPSWGIVKTDGVEKIYVCGSVLNTYAVAREQVTVTIYINGVRERSRTYQFVPPEGVIRFSILLGGRQVDENNVKVVATGKPVDADTIVWAIDTTRMDFKEEKDKVVWSGFTRNRSSVPVKDVKIYCDFFDDEGIQGNDKPVIGELVLVRTIGAGKSANFRVEFSEFGAADIYKTIVARAVGQKY